MKSLEEIQKEVGEWSRENFGEQRSKHNTVMYIVSNKSGVFGSNEHPLYLGSLAPLLGIVEEIGELAAATEAGDMAEMKDAVGDILIYLCDYTSREATELNSDILGLAEDIVTDAEDDPERVRMNPFLGLSQAAGRLCHATLKWHQGIRGFDDPEKYRAARDAAIARLLVPLSLYVSIYLPGDSLIKLLNNVWENEVKKRNWRKENGTDAAES